MSYGKLRNKRKRAFDQQTIKRSCASLTHSALDIPCEDASPQCQAPFLQATTSLLRLCLLNTRHASKISGVWGLAPKNRCKISTCPLTKFKTVAQRLVQPQRARGVGNCGRSSRPMQFSALVRCQQIESVSVKELNQSNRHSYKIIGQFHWSATGPRRNTPVSIATADF